MAWQFNSEGFGSAINRGLKDAEESILKEKDRLRQQALDDLAGADKYKKRKVDASGNTIGYESDQDARAKAIDFVRKRLPGYAKPAPATTIKPYQQVMQEQGLNPVTGDVAAPQLPAPLIENTNKTKLEQAAADRELDMSKGVLASQEAEKSRQHDLAKAAAAIELKKRREDAQSNNALSTTREYDLGGDPSGTVRPYKSNIAFDTRNVTGSAQPKEEPQGVDPSMVNSIPPPPLPIEVPAEEADPLDVDDYTLRRLVDQVTSPTTTKDGATPAGAYSDTLDPALQKRLGVEGQSIFLPFSFIARGIQSQQGERAQADKSIGAETYDAIAELESGVPYSVVARKLSEAWGGKIPPQVAAELRSARAAIAGEGQRNVVNRAREESRNDKTIEKQDRALERFQKAYAGTGILDAIAPLEILERETGVISGNINRNKLPGQGTNALRAVPLVGNALATGAAKSYGGEATQQALQALLNVKIRNTSGQAVTKYEEGRILVEAGMGPGGNEDDVARGVRLMVQGLKEAGQSVKAAFPQEVISTYTEQGGPLPELAFGPIKKSGGGGEKKAKPTDAYSQDLEKAQDLFTQYRNQIQEQMAKNGLGAAWAARQINDRRAKVDAYFKEKHKKPFEEPRE